MPFKQLFFLLGPNAGESVHGLLIDTPTASHRVGDGVLIVTMSLYFLPLSVRPFHHLLCRSCSVSSICRCIFSVLVGGGEFKVFLCRHLGHLF